MREKEVNIICADGFILKGTLFEPAKVKSAVMIAPATGIKRQFYTSFSRHLSSNGFATLIFDNRGIGQSIQGSINTGKPSLSNWGILDMTAALEFLKNSIPNSDYHLVGHSAGGQLAGLMKNAKDLKSMFNFGSSSGSLRYTKYPFKLKSSFWLNCYIPLCNWAFGHTKSNWIGMGEPLPKGVGREFTRWCNGKGYVKVDLGSKIKEHQYDELRLHSMWLHATDDDIANHETVKDMIRVYPNISAEIVSLSPQAEGFEDIGHMKFFSKRRKALWQMSIDWLNKN